MHRARSHGVCLQPCCHDGGPQLQGLPNNVFHGLKSSVDMLYAVCGQLLCQDGAFEEGQLLEKRKI